MTPENTTAGQLTISSSLSSNRLLFMKQLLLSLFTLYVCATSIAQDTVVVPVNFDFASTNEDSINIIFAKLDEALDSQYGEPTRNLEGTVWHGPNDVDIVLSNDRSARTYIPDPRREGLTTEAMIIQVLYLKKNE